jgi:hypothetical protein
MDPAGGQRHRQLRRKPGRSQDDGEPGIGDLRRRPARRLGTLLAAVRRFLRKLLDRTGTRPTTLG